MRRFLTGNHQIATSFQPLFVVHPIDFTEAIIPTAKQLGIEYLDELRKGEHRPYPLVLTLTFFVYHLYQSSYAIQSVCRFDSAGAHFRTSLPDLTHEFDQRRARLTPG